MVDIILSNLNWHIGIAPTQNRSFFRNPPINGFAIDRFDQSVASHILLVPGNVARRNFFGVRNGGGNRKRSGVEGKIYC